MRKYMYVAGIVAAFAIGMYQGPAEAVPDMSGSEEWLCNASGIDENTPCPGTNSCTDDYDPASTTPPLDRRYMTSTLDCKTTGCTYSWSMSGVHPDKCTVVE